MLVLYDFFVFDDLSIKFIDQQVDGGVHVGIFAFRENILAGQVDIGFYFLSKFFHT